MHKGYCKDVGTSLKKIINYFIEFYKGGCSICKWGYYQPRKFLIDDQKKIVYLVMHKVANTSIEASFLNYQGSDDIEVHIIASESEKAWINKKEKGYFKFTYVRNPFERLVSCYESKYHTDKKWIGKTLPHLWYDNYLFGYMSKDEGFDVFIRKVCKIPNMWKDFHVLPQYNTLYNRRGHRLVDYVGRMENIGKSYPKIQKRYGLAELKHLNQSQKRNWMDYYTIDTAQMVYKAYKKDIEVLGYKKEYVKLMQYLSSKTNRTY
ncbi:MAG: sulfotransferase family protein [Lachnospiraceae bacterium]